MTKDKGIKMVVPPLRFPEFRDAKRWEIVHLSRACEVVGGGTPDTKEDSYWNGDILWLTPSEVGDRFISNSIRKITLQGLKNSSAKLLPAGSIVLTSRATLGEMSILKVEASTNQGFQSLVPKKEANKEYIYYLQPIIKEQCLKFAKGSTFLEVSSTSVKSFEIPFTSSEEQAKIADCLGSLDDLISAVADKTEALKEYKKGLMQQLFPADGKTTPALRFPEFQNAGEWKETTLGGICDMQAGKFVSASEIYKVKKEAMYPCYGGNGLRGYTHSFTHFGIYPLIGRQGAQCGNITYVEGKFHATEHAVVVSLKKDIDIRWLYYLLIKLNLNQYATGQAQPGLSVDIIKKVAIRIPENKNEQQQIACSILSIDDLISVEIQKLDQLKAHKKGLMQQLFPNLQ